MKNNFTNIMITGLIALPFAAIYLLYDQVNPFHLLGKQFLLFFIIHSLGIYFAIILNNGRVKNQVEQLVPHYTAHLKDGPTPNKTYSGLLITASMLLGISRLIQGVSNHKPVGYLALLLVLNMIIYVYIWSFSLMKRD